MTEEIMIGKKDVVSCNYWKACDYYKQLKRLEQENKELKKENENYKLYGSSTTVAPVNHTNTEYDLLYGQSMLYKSTLEEISEKIKSLNKDICNNCGWHNTDNCQPNGYVCHDLIEIKNKINEVLKG
jgi:hypothetical protein